jgi:hypothetical protein
VSYLGTVAIPSPGPWRLLVTASTGQRTLTGATDLLALDPGSTPALGSPAPGYPTPTFASGSTDPRTVTTDEMPDRRLYAWSVPDAQAAHKPFVLVIDSPRFQVSSACGKALGLARFLQDRWPDQLFIHVEPYRYSIVTDTPILEGSLDDPPLTDATARGGSELSHGERVRCRGSSSSTAMAPFGRSTRAS